MSSITVEIDQMADAAYVRLSPNQVDRSVPIGDDVVVDVDDMGVVVGIEMLALDADIPYTTLVSDFHVHSDVTALLRRLRPSITGFLSLSMGEGKVAAGSRARIPA